MTDRWTITCGICGLIGPALARNLPPSTGCLHDATVPDGDRICYPARVMVLEHALRRAVAPDCFDDDRNILPGKIGHVLMATHAAHLRSAQDMRRGTADTAPDPITTAAQMMLENYDAFLAGRPFDAAMNDRLVLAAIYGTAAYRAAPSRNTGTTALIKVFLQALISTSLRDLDYLRGGMSAGAKAREARNG